MYKLIATDIDGTLLNNKIEIHPENIQPIKRALNNGIKIVMCSGRSHITIDDFSKQLGLVEKSDFHIAFNGGLIYNSYTREHLREINLEASITNEILKTVKDYDVVVIIYKNDELIFSKDVEHYKNYENYKNTTNLKLTLNKNLTKVDTPVSKVIINGKREELERVETLLKNKFGSTINLFFSSKVFLEIVNIETSKGIALEILAKHLGVDMKEVIAVGDNYNDISMIKAAGLGVAVSNAEQALKNEADYITKNSNEDAAIKEVIEKFIFNK